VSCSTQAREELRELVATSKQLAVQSATEIDRLDDVTRVWAVHVEFNTPRDSEDIGIVEARTPDDVIDNARNLMQTLRRHEQLRFTVKALSEVDQQYDHAKAAYDARQAARVAVQAKQHELQAVAADVQKELVKLRTVVRIALGPSHIDYQRLRLRIARAGVDEATETQDETPPPATDSSSGSEGASVETSDSTT
jgi:hypothetical protein